EGEGPAQAGEAQGKLAHDALAHHHNCFADVDTGDPHPMERYSTQRPQSRLLVGDTIGDALRRIRVVETGQIVPSIATVSDRARAAPQLPDVLAHGHDVTQAAPALPVGVLDVLVPPGPRRETSAEDGHLGTQIHHREVVTYEHVARARVGHGCFL